MSTAVASTQAHTFPTALFCCAAKHFADPSDGRIAPFIKRVYDAMAKTRSGLFLCQFADTWHPQVVALWIMRTCALPSDDWDCFKVVESFFTQCRTIERIAAHVELVSKLVHELLSFELNTRPADKWRSPWLDRRGLLSESL